MPTPDLRLFGIRHHGPGSAASLLKALDEFRPDIVLLECPADAEAALAAGTHPELKPPVALLVFNPKQPEQASFLPFASFSPEWQALHWCERHGAHLRCFDLPLALRFGLEVPAPSLALIEEAETGAAAAPAAENCPPDPEPASENAEASGEAEKLLSTPPTDEPPAEVRRDPISYLAELDGYADGERWWELRLEHAAGHADTFATVLAMMAALREQLSQAESEETLLREAFMRETMRSTLKQGYQRVAVVCGAWHAPVLQEAQLKTEAKADKARLKSLKKAPTEATWIPWTYERLATSSGYGAGVVSPAWYELLFHIPHPEVVTHWMVRAARLLREQDLDASSAHTIEAVRLAHTLAVVRGRALPGIEELEEAAVAIFGGGYEEALHLVHEQLVIGGKLGEVPADLPATPLQQDVAHQQKAVRLKPEISAKVLDLDLRQELHLQRSYLLHRLRLLSIPWGTPQKVHGKSGTFHEVWEVRWQPEFALPVIEAGLWGRTVLEAATRRVRQRGREAQQLEEVSTLIAEALQANLGAAIPALVARLETLSADTRDVTHLLAALPPLVSVLRYGNVRRTETSQVAQVVHKLIPRLCISLPQACTGLDHDAASQLLPRIEATHRAILLLEESARETDWYAALRTVGRNPASNGLLAGATTRLLFDAQQLLPEATATALGLALAPAQPTEYATAWIEGFLSGSGLLLIHHHALFSLLDEWLSGLDEAVFQEIVPLLRRAFTGFSLAERRQVLELAAGDSHHPKTLAAADDINLDRGLRVLPVLRELLGIAPKSV